MTMRQYTDVLIVGEGKGMDDDESVYHSWASLQYF